MSAKISIIVPVFNAASQLARCLDALQRTISSSVPVIIIDDASTDPKVDAVIAPYADRWRVIRHAENAGFVVSANRGMREAGANDVVLLNSDTIPAGLWLEQVQRCADSDPAIASITPWSNNGEIVSLPKFCQAAAVPGQPERWAEACAIGSPAYPDLPTAVGFCMYLRRRCLEQIGDFDAQTFGHGYGEENDWCMRASAVGWRHVLCDSAFVAHEGNASFAALGLQPGQASMQRLLAKHPDYLQQVQRFIQEDPLDEARRRVMTAMARNRSSD
ncbi:MAG: glycosyltransferase [Wenzhouxiangellaceae bacterium]|nr:glycosyltransferase [Wenzhouxiangellaceae bacterium]